MKILKKMLILVMVIIIISTLLSVSKATVFADSALNSNNRNVVEIAVLWANSSNLLVQKLEKSLKDLQNKEGSNVRFTFYDLKNNIAIQNEIIDNLLKNGTDILMMDLTDKRESTIKEIIDKTTQKNIPIILSNIDPIVASKFSELSPKVVFVQQDDKEYARLQGKIIVDLWNTNRNIIDKNRDNVLQYIMLQGNPNNIVAVDRSKGSISAINDAGIKTQELALENANWDIELAKSLIESLFLRYNKNIEAIIANSDTMAIGAVEALQKYGYNKGDKSKNIIVVGYNGVQEAKDLIDKGFMTGTIDEDTNAIARGFYTIGMNLINNVDPLENTNHKLNDSGIIILTIPHNEYMNKTMISQ